MVIFVCLDPPTVSASGPSEAVEGYSVILTCSGSGYPPGLIDVIWMKDGVPLQSMKMIMFYTSTNFNTIMKT